MVEKKTVEDFVAYDYPVLCKGRDPKGEEISEMEPFEVKVHVYKCPDSNIISSDVSDCKYNCGGHGEKCSAFREGAFPSADCCYYFNLPVDLIKK